MRQKLILGGRARKLDKGARHFAPVAPKAAMNLRWQLRMHARDTYQDRNRGQGRMIFGELPKTTTGKIRKNELRDLVRAKS